jgi:hypothetical protein
MSMMILPCCAQPPQKQMVGPRIRFVCLKCHRGERSPYRKSESAAVRAWEVDPEPWDRAKRTNTTLPVNPATR